MVLATFAITGGVVSDGSMVGNGVRDGVGIAVGIGVGVDISGVGVGTGSSPSANAGLIVRFIARV